MDEVESRPSRAMVVAPFSRAGNATQPLSNEREVYQSPSRCDSLKAPQEIELINNTTAPAALRSDPRQNEPSLQDLRAAAKDALRIIYLNIFLHNSTRFNSARYECGWRFNFTICWRDGDPVPCPAAVGYEIAGRAGHQLEIECNVSVVENALHIRLRVDDARLLDNFPPVSLGEGRARELQSVLAQQFGLAYPSVEGRSIG
jgi:hypothetical protein